jgi:hypothetical protein
VGDRTGSSELRGQAHSAVVVYVVAVATVAAAAAVRCQQSRLKIAAPCWL